MVTAGPCLIRELVFESFNVAIGNCFVWTTPGLKPRSYSLVWEQDRLGSVRLVMRRFALDDIGLADVRIKFEPRLDELECLVGIRLIEFVDECVQVVFDRHPMLDYRTLPAWLPQELVRPVEAG